MPVSTPTEQPISPRRQATRDRLVQAAADVIARRGVHVGVAEICEAAGFTRGAFYSNFADRDELIAAILERHVHQVIEAVEEVRQHGLTSDDLGLVVERFLPLAQPDLAFHLIVAELSLDAARDPEQFGARLAPLEQLTTRIEEALVDGLASIGLRFAIPPADGVQVLGAIADTSQRDALVRGEADPSRLARATLPTVLAAITEPLPE